MLAASGLAKLLRALAVTFAQRGRRVRVRRRRPGVVLDVSQLQALPARSRPARTGNELATCHLVRRSLTATLYGLTAKRVTGVTAKRVTEPLGPATREPRERAADVDDVEAVKRLIDPTRQRRPRHR
jgi:hypothetical protein